MSGLNFALNFLTKKIANKALEEGSDTYERIHKEIFDIKELNEGEEGFLKEIRQNAKEVDVLSVQDAKGWSEKDVEKIMISPQYQYNKGLQDKVQKYFDKKYPGKTKYDATGKIVD